MLPIVATAQPDQTISSLAALAWWLNAMPGWSSVKHRVFGGFACCQTQTAFHGGVSQCFEALGGAGSDTVSQFLDEHGYVRLLGSLASPEVYHQVTKKILTNHPWGTEFILGLSAGALISPVARYCHKCVDAELARVGYAYAHRTQQHIGVKVCPDHGVPIVACKLDCNDGLAIRGILTSSSCKVFDDCSIDTVDFADDECHLLAKQFAQWVKSLLEGKVPLISVSQRLEAISRRLAEVKRWKDVGQRLRPSSLQQLVVTRFGDTFLRQVGLAVSHASTANWPSLLSAGTAFTAHPVANLLVLATLFETTDDFVDYLRHQGPADVNGAAKKPSSRSVFRKGLSLSLVKSFFSESSIQRIAQRHGTTVKTVAAYLNAYPAIKARRRAALHREHRRRFRRTLTMFLSNHPFATRKQFSECHQTDWKWLMNHDREWFDRALPKAANSARGRPRRSPTELADLDWQTSQFLETEFERLLGVPGQASITAQTLISWLHPWIRQLIEEDRLPLVAKTLNDLSQSIASRGDVSSTPPVAEFECNASLILRAA